MSEKLNQIMDSIFQSLSSLSGEIGRNIDVPQQIETEGRIISINDASEISSERPLGGFGTVSHQQRADIVVVVSVADHTQLDLLFAETVSDIRDALLVDVTFGGLVDGFEMTAPDMVSDTSQGSLSLKAGTIPVTFYYDTDSFF